LPETVWWFVQYSAVSFFALVGRNVSDGLQKAAVVEPIDLFERGELHGFEVAPWSSPMDDLGLVEAVDRFGQSVVITVANMSIRNSERLAEAGIEASVGSTYCEPRSE
jgi:hypothetical protein